MCSAIIFPERRPLRLFHNTVKAKPCLQGGTHFGNARAVGYPPRKAASRECNGGEAVCASASKTGEMGLPMPVGAQMLL